MSSRRVIVIGAGAIGGLIAARLYAAGTDTVVVARGAAFGAIATDGIVVVTPSAREHVRVPVVTRPGDLRFRGDDIVVLATKSQDTASALGEVFAAAPAGTPVVCAQNGVANEREALRHTADVLGMLVLCPSERPSPGVVAPPDGPVPGVLDVGVAGTGSPRLAAEVSLLLEGAGFASENRADIMSWKYRKLIANLGNVVEALCGVGHARGELTERAVGEARACLDAAGLDVVGDEEYQARAGLLRFPAGRGGSTWQSRSRGATSWETPYLNGEITLLGHQTGTAVPVNELLVSAAAAAAAAGGRAPLLDEADLLARLPS